MDSPTVEIEPRMKRGRKTRRARGRLGPCLRLWLRRLALAAVALLALPVLLSLAYLPSAVHPVSTLMLIVTSVPPLLLHLANARARKRNRS